MHSILALGAGHVVRTGDPSLMSAACFHRSMALVGVNELMSRPDRSTSDDDALIAACYALSFQVACIGDSSTAFWVSTDEHRLS